MTVNNTQKAKAQAIRLLAMAAGRLQKYRQQKMKVFSWCDLSDSDQLALLAAKLSVARATVESGRFGDLSFTCTGDAITGACYIQTTKRRSPEQIKAWWIEQITQRGTALRTPDNYLIPGARYGRDDNQIKE